MAENYTELVASAKPRRRRGSPPSFRGARLRANPESRGVIYFWIPGSRLRTALRGGPRASPRNDGNKPPVIVRRPPQSGEPRRMGHRRNRSSFETPRKRAAPQDDGGAAQD